MEAGDREARGRRGQGLAGTNKRASDPELSLRLWKMEGNREVAASPVTARAGLLSPQRRGEEGSIETKKFSLALFYPGSSRPLCLARKKKAASGFCRDHAFSYISYMYIQVHHLSLSHSLSIKYNPAPERVLFDFSLASWLHTWTSLVKKSSTATHKVPILAGLFFFFIWAGRETVARAYIFFFSWGKVFSFWVYCNFISAISFWWRWSFWQHSLSVCLEKIWEHKGLQRKKEHPTWMEVKFLMNTGAPPWRKNKKK